MFPDRDGRCWPGRLYEYPPSGSHQRPIAAGGRDFGVRPARTGTVARRVEADGRSPAWHRGGTPAGDGPVRHPGGGRPLYPSPAAAGRDELEGTCPAGV